MKITEQDIKTVATLSRLKIRDDESAKVLENLNKILTYVENLNSIDTTLMRCQCKMFFAQM